MTKRILAGGLVLVAAGLLLATPSAGTVHGDPDDLIINGGFEAGTTFDSWTIVDQPGSEGAWCPQSGTLWPGDPCGSGGDSVPAPPEGSTAAMTGQSGPGSHVLFQCATLPDPLASADLSFQLYLNKLGHYVTGPDLDHSGSPNQQFRADLVDGAAMVGDHFTVAGADILMNLYQTQLGDPRESGYSPVVADVSAFAGQDVCIRFAAVDNQSRFKVGIDDVSLDAVGVLPSPTNTSEPAPTGTAQPTATVAATVAATAADVTLPQTGAGAQGSAGPTGWHIAALLGSAALAAAGYGALRRRRA